VGYPGHFVECYTRQKGTVLSAITISLCKMAHLRTNKASLSSAVAQALDKEVPFAECLSALGKRTGKEPTGASYAESPSIRHSARSPFAEWLPELSAKGLAKGPLEPSLSSV
jgi:hypothetical protein